MTVLYVAPHFDDVALSCACALLSRARAGERIFVCTLFTRGGDEAADRLRADEDRAAMALIGGEPIALGLVDAPLRLGVPASFRALVLEPAIDPQLVEAVEAALSAVIAEIGPDEVWLPLGVGGHIDHRTAFAARGAAGVRARFYADRPYAFVPALLAMRLRELGGPPGEPASAADIERQLVDGGCAALAATSDDCVEIARRLAQPPCEQLAIRAHAIRHARALLPAAAQLIECYRSQVDWLFGNEPVQRVWQRLAMRGDRWLEHEFVIGNGSGASW